ncbi:hypothetical protein M405DRAFT_809563 [Rhizopogon salebrosus TDB-379]|nr:hypothetical protein M405DRAFT_809563 [Rhizopogon salebrosus TDB-379]
MSHSNAHHVDTWRRIIALEIWTFRGAIILYMICGTTLTCLSGGILTSYSSFKSIITVFHTAGSLASFGFE